MVYLMVYAIFKVLCVFYRSCFWDSNLLKKFNTKLLLFKLMIKLGATILGNRNIKRPVFHLNLLNFIQ